MSAQKKLQECRVKLQSSNMKKSGHNKFAGYNYFELGDFLPAINQMFHECGLFSQVSYTADTATLTITDTEDGSSVSFTSPMGSAALKGCHEVQNIGAVETYQRRYLYVTALEIVEHDALDSSEPVKEKAFAKPHKPTDGADKTLTEEEKQQVEAVYSSMLDWINEGSFDDAVLVKENAGMSSEQVIHLWTKFDSKQRASLKKAAQSLREKSELATQP